MVADFIAFISNSITITLLVAYVFALWAALVAWTWIDINARTDNAFYKLGAVLVVATGAVLGFAIYLLLRPNMTRDEAALREVEEAILTSQSQFLTCPHCYSAIKEEFAYCQNCSRRLATNCISCERTINNSWDTCPHCGTRQKEVEVAVPAPTLPSGEPLVSVVRAENKNPGAVFFSSLGSFFRKINENRQRYVAKAKSSSRKSKRGAKAPRRKRA